MGSRSKTIAMIVTATVAVLSFSAVLYVTLAGGSVPLRSNSADGSESEDASDQHDLQFPTSGGQDMRPRW